MAVRELTPYLIFPGNADAAIAHYVRVLDASVEMLQRYGEMPGGDCQPADRQRVLHARVRVGPALLMISDDREGTCTAAATRVHLSLDFADPVELTQRFDALAAGGSVCLPLHDAFWGARFGMLTDAFGINWMLNCTLPATAPA
jgi:PhnB protein